MQRKTSNLLPILIALALIGVIAYAAVTQLSIQNNGIVVGLTAYDVPSEGTPIESIEWGNIFPGEISDQVIYIESALEKEITLVIDYVGFPTAEGWGITYLPTTLTILADATTRLEVTFTLTVPANTGEVVTIDFQTTIDIAEV